MIFEKYARLITLSTSGRGPSIFLAPKTLVLLLLISLLYPDKNLAQDSRQPMSTKTAIVTANSNPDLKPNPQKDKPEVDQSDILPAVHKYRLDIGYTSLYFTAIPLGGAVLLIILALWIGKPDIKDRLYPFFGDGQFGQYVVVILVAGNVCTLAIVGILGRSEVAAIYGGIIGYVLGKKAGNNGNGDSKTTT